MEDINAEDELDTPPLASLLLASGVREGAWNAATPESASRLIAVESLIVAYIVYDICFRGAVLPIIGMVRNEL